MIRPFVLAALMTSTAVWAKSEPCRVKSRQLTLAKNCFSGDMSKDGAPQFFAFTSGPTAGANYCYNSLIELENKAGQLKIRVLRDSKDGQMHAYQFALHADEFKKAKTALVSLKGLKGECFSPAGDKEVCNGGFLKTIGLTDTALPMILSVTKSGPTQFTVSHLAHDPKEIEANKPKELEGAVIQDTAALTAKMVGDIHHRLSMLANVKMAQARSGKSTPRKMAESSEQFRFCSMAFEGFLKAQKLSDPFTTAEHNTMNSLISYMNNDPHFDQISRMPASSTPVVKHGK